MQLIKFFGGIFLLGCSKCWRFLFGNDRIHSGCKNAIRCVVIVFLAIFTAEKKNMKSANSKKIVPFKTNRTSKWFAEQLNVNPSVVSIWCLNSSRPDLLTIIKAKLLEIEHNEPVNKKFVESI